MVSRKLSGLTMKNMFVVFIQLMIFILSEDEGYLHNLRVYGQTLINQIVLGRSSPVLIFLHLNSGLTFY